MNKIKSLFLGFLKPLVLAHVSDLSALAPVLAGVITSKTNLSPADAQALSIELVNVIETEVTALINKI